jgi:RNA polymerase sigma factor (sigma-70 family)
VVTGHPPAERGWETFEEFYRARLAGAVRRGVLVLGDRGAAEEIAQDVFLLMSRNWPRLELPDAWLKTVLSRRLIRRADRLRRTRWAAQLLAGSDRAVLRDPEEIVGLRADYARVRKAIDRLPGRQRLVVVLRYLDELTQAETADVLGVNASTVDTHERRAMARLHAEFGRHGERLVGRLAEEGGTR